MAIYVSFTNISHRGGGGERESFVKIFHIMTSLDDERHKYRAMGFDHASVGIMRYSLGIPLLMYDTLMSFNAGRENSGDLEGNVA